MISSRVERLIVWALAAVALGVQPQSSQAAPEAQPIALVRTFDYDRPLEKPVLFAAALYSRTNTKQFFTALQNGEIAGWNEDQAQALWTVKVRDKEDDVVEQAALSADGKLLAVVGSGAFLQILDASSGKPLPVQYSATGANQLPLVPHFTSVAFSGDGKYLAAGDANGQIFIWDTATPEALGVLKSQDYLIKALAFSTSGEFLVSSSPAEVLIWNWPKREIAVNIKDTLGDGPFWVDSVYLPSYERIMVVTTMDSTVILDIASGKVLKRFPIPQADEQEKGRPLVTIIDPEMTHLWRFLREPLVQKLNLEGGQEEAAFLDANLLEGGALAINIYSQVARKPDEPSTFVAGAVTWNVDLATGELKMLTRLRHYRLPL